MIKIEGVEKLQRQLAEAQAAIKDFGSETVNVSFDVNDATSIEVAIQNAASMIDQRMSTYAENPFVAPLIEQFKEASRNAILERAAETRLLGDAQ